MISDFEGHGSESELRINNKKTTILKKENNPKNVWINGKETEKRSNLSRPTIFLQELD